MVEAAPLNYPLIWGITIAILIGVIIVVSTFLKIIWKIPYKISLSHHVGCLWAILLFIGGAFVYGRVMEHYPPKTVEIVVVNRNGTCTHKKYIDYFEPPNGQKVTYEDQRNSKGYYLYNNTSSVIEEVHHFYGERASSLPNEIVTKEVYSGDLVDLIIEPDYMFTPAPNTETITTRHNNKINSTTKTQLRFSDKK